MNNATRIILIIVKFNLGGRKIIKEKRKLSLRSLFSKEKKIFHETRFRSQGVKINLILDAFYFLAIAVLRKREITMKIIVRSIRMIKAFHDIIFQKSASYIIKNSILVSIIMNGIKFNIIYINFNRIMYAYKS